MPEPYSLKEVAAELGLHPQTVKYHIYHSGHFAGLGKLVGKTLTFTEVELQELRKRQQNMPPRGRRPASDSAGKQKRHKGEADNSG